MSDVKRLTSTTRDDEGPEGGFIVTTEASGKAYRYVLTITTPREAGEDGETQMGEVRVVTREVDGHEQTPESTGAVRSAIEDYGFEVVN